MEYKFSLTPRLVAVGLFSMVALFVLLFLPLDKIMQQVATGAIAPEPVPPPATAPAAGGAIDPRTRDNARSRERESR